MCLWVLCVPSINGFSCWTGRLECEAYKHLSFSINNEPIAYEYIGKEINKNLHDIYLYFEINKLEKVEIKSIYIENTLFLEISPNQTNIVIVECNDQNFNLTFTKDLKNKKIILNKWGNLEVNTPPCLTDSSSSTK